MNNLHHIATTVAQEFDRHPNDLKRKRYSKLTSIQDMKQAFVKRCYDEGIPNKEIAQYMDHNPTTITSIYSRAVGGITYKYQKVLQQMKSKGYVKRDDFSDTPGIVSYLRTKGHHIYRDGDMFKLA